MQIDDAFGFGWKVRFLWRQWIADSLRARRVDHRAQREPAYSCKRLLQEVTPRGLLYILDKGVHRFKNISSKFSSAFATTVQAAYSAAFPPSGIGPIGLVAISIALLESFKYRFSIIS